MGGHLSISPHKHTYLLAKLYSSFKVWVYVGLSELRDLYIDGLFAELGDLCDTLDTVMLDEDPTIRSVHAVKQS